MLDVHKDYMVLVCFALYCDGWEEREHFQFDLQLFCILLKRVNIQRTLPFSVAPMEGEGPELLWLSHGSALSAHCVCCRQQTQKMWSEMRREEKNRQTEWESSRWDDIMCTAAKLQPHRNKGLHSCKAIPRACRMCLLGVYCFSYTYIHMATLVPNVLFLKCCCQKKYWVSFLIPESNFLISII